MNKLQSQKIVVASCFSWLAVSVAPAATLLDFNGGGAGKNFTGWTWVDRTEHLSGAVAGRLGVDQYGTRGWTQNSGKWASGTGSNWLPRIQEKGASLNPAVKNSVSFAIDPDQKAPFTSAGASLKVFDDGTAAVNHAGGLYLWKDNFGKQGLADASTNRLDFYTKFIGIPPAVRTNRNPAIAMHFGTYLCGPTCFKEDPTNQHYYHYLNTSPGAWLHVQLDNHPQHRRGNSGYQDPGNNPAVNQIGLGNYWQHMNQFYFEVLDGPQPETYWIDEMRLWTQRQPENEISIASVWVGYWPESRNWEIGWQDGSFFVGNPYGSVDYTKAPQSTFEIRYSQTPITNDNFDAARLVDPQYFKVANGRVNRHAPMAKPVWTRFALPPDFVASNKKVYFAIKDVSTVANGDGHNSVSTLIRTIDYALRPDTTNTPQVGSQNDFPPPLRVRVLKISQ